VRESVEAAIVVVSPADRRRANEVENLDRLIILKTKQKGDAIEAMLMSAQALVKILIYRRRIFVRRPPATAACEASLAR
jgi:precorrin-2 methylase